MILIGLDGYLSSADAAPTAIPRNPSARKIKPKRFMAIASTMMQRLFRQIDLHFRCDLAPGVELALEPGLGLLRRLADLDADHLLVEGPLQRRVLRGFDDRLEQRVDHRLRRRG